MNSKKSGRRKDSIGLHLETNKYHLIWVDTSEKLNTQILVLFHELVHAYQCENDMFQNIPDSVPYEKREDEKHADKQAQKLYIKYARMFA